LARKGKLIHCQVTLQTPIKVQELIEALQNPTIDPTKELHGDLSIMLSITLGGIVISIDEDTQEVWLSVGQDYGQGCGLLGRKPPPFLVR